MTEVMKAIYGFLTATAGVPVYTENGVPTDAVLPYVTYSPIITPWDGDSLTIVRVWDRSNSYKRISGIVDKLSNAVNESATIKVSGSGYVYLYKGDPWVQMQPMDSPDIKVAYLNLGISTII